MRRDIQEILTIVRLHLSEGEAESLVGWMAHRLGRVPSLAGAGDPLRRLEHIVTHWLDDEQRTSLRAWLARQIALGEPRSRPDERRIPRAQCAAGLEHFDL